MVKLLEALRKIMDTLDDINEDGKTVEDARTVSGLLRGMAIIIDAMLVKAEKIQMETRRVRYDE